MFPLELHYLEKILRPIIVYFFLVFLLRIFGKRELAQLNPFDFVVLLSLSNTVQNAIIGDDNSVLGGMIGAVTLVWINYLTVKFLRSHHNVDVLVEGEESLLIKDGKVCDKMLKDEMITENDLLAVIRRQGFSSFDDIASCAIEPNGSFAIIPKKPSIGDMQQAELMRELAAIKKDLSEIRVSLAADSKT